MKLILAGSWGHEKVIFQIPLGFSRNTTPGITGLFAQVPTGWLEAPGGQEKEGPVECSLSTNKQSKTNNQEKNKQRKREEHKRDWLNKERTKGNQKSKERMENKSEENTENLFKPNYCIRILRAVHVQLRRNPSRYSNAHLFFVQVAQEHTFKLS